MRCQLAEVVQDLPEVVQDRQEAEGLEQVAVCSAVDYPLPANRLRRNFRQSRRMLPRAAL